MPLLNRRAFPPGGYWYFESRTAWPPLDTAQSYFAGKTFDQVVDEVIAHRQKNPRFGMSTDRVTVENELDFFTCARLKWDPNYCSGGPGGKALRPPQAAAVGAVRSRVGAAVEKVQKYVSGLGVLLGWLGDGGKAVPPETSWRRAGVCVGCPRNEPGDWESFFTGLAAEKIRQQLGVRNEMNLSTPLDDKLNICTACLCCLKLKVHTPLAHVVKKLKPEMRAELDGRCWILDEEKQAATVG